MLVRVQDITSGDKFVGETSMEVVPSIGDRFYHGKFGPYLVERRTFFLHKPDGDERAEDVLLEVSAG